MAQPEAQKYRGLEATPNIFAATKEKDASLQEEQAFFAQMEKFSERPMISIEVDRESSSFAVVGALPAQPRSRSSAPPTQASPGEVVFRADAAGATDHGEMLPALADDGAASDFDAIFAAVDAADAIEPAGRSHRPAPHRDSSDVACGCMGSWGENIAYDDGCADHDARDLRRRPEYETDDEVGLTD
ncbi:hypothetical protein JL722_5731 [Aureococcus anophagefferens]|nr:hypothetical protein JL722_5731 [Aureococcus anophagefferens]